MSTDLPPESPTLSNVVEVMREYLDKRQTGRLELNQRLDWVVQQLGVVAELSHRVDLLDESAEGLRLVQDSMVKVLEQAQVEFDLRTQMVLRDSNLLRGTVSEASVAFQRAQEDQNEDWDDKWSALQKQLDKIAEDKATVTVAKIGRNERIVIALLVLLGGVISSAITLLVTLAAQKP